LRGDGVVVDERVGAHLVAADAREQTLVVRRAPGGRASGGGDDGENERGAQVMHAPYDSPSTMSRSDQRLLNWKRLRAPGRPYFLRSTRRASRVNKPAFFSGPRILSSALHSARARPWRMAPA